MRLMRAGDATDAWTTLSVARVVERRADNQVQLDRVLLPPLLDVAGHAVDPSAGSTSCWACCTSAARRWPARMTQRGTGGVAEIADFLLLQTVNRNEPVFAHLRAAPMLHPQRFYEQALALAGDLATFRDARRAAALRALRARRPGGAASGR